ncbi:MAG: OmpA family protein [Planctomycetes bacterium]|nr:OmpA family protein [Planctomycetota bacterium]
MFKVTTLGMVSALAFMGVTTGCANKSTKRIAHLEQANRGLTGQLNRSRGELEAAYRDGEALNQRLADLMRESGSLRTELASAEALAQEQAAAPGWTPVPGGAMIAIESGILFSPGKTVLRKQAKRMLDAVVSTIEGEYADKHIFVFGHTDNSPINKSGWKDNWELSTQRSLEVVRYMADRGVARLRLVAGGCGENRPRVANSSEANRGKNRRVEIFAIDSALLAGG